MAKEFPNSLVKKNWLGIPNHSVSDMVSPGFLFKEIQIFDIMQLVKGRSHHAKFQYLYD